MGNIIRNRNSNSNIKIKQTIKVAIANYRLLSMVPEDIAEAGLCDPTIKRRDWDV